MPLVCNLHSWDVTTEEAVEIQRALRSRVALGSYTGRTRFIGGADVSYSTRGGRLCAAVVIVDIDTMETVEAVAEQGESSFPYITGLLSFREVPIILEAWKKVRQVPDVLICDGQGIAHPRGMGVATHAGIILGVPTVGCAKKRLVGAYDDVGNTKGSFSLLHVKGRAVGAVVRTRDQVNPVFVSPGCGIDLASSITVILKSCHGYRLPEPVRRAHGLANQTRSKK